MGGVKSHLFLLGHPGLACCKRFEPRRRLNVFVVPIHRAVVLNVLQRNPRSDLQLETRSDILLDLAIDLISDGAFQIIIETKLQRSPTLLVLRGLGKIVQGVKLLHNFSRDATHPDETLLFIQPSNQSALIVTATPGGLMALEMPESPGRLQVCRGCHSHIHAIWVDAPRLYFSNWVVFRVLLEV